MLKIPFVKMHGLGNDFVIISKKDLPADINIDNFAILISHRRKGIGCDQFIIYDYNDPSNVEMEIYNQDGSKALACGNASRSISRLIFDLKGEKNIILKISDRQVKCQYLHKNEIEVNMGKVSFDEAWMPDEGKLWGLAESYLIEPKEMLCVDVANPHIVIFSKLSDKDRKIIGSNFQNIDLFPDGINVNFAIFQDDKIYLKVWERGTGFTYACGSGAVATFAAANKLGFAENEIEIVFALGSLKMKKEGENITMCGPASYIFSGDFLYE